MLNNAFRDQLLKAGVVTEEQVQKVADDEAKKKEKAKQRRAAAAKQKNAKRKNNQSTKTNKKPNKAKKDSATASKQATEVAVETKAVTRDVSKHDQVDRLLKEHGIACGSGKQYSYPAANGKLNTIEVSEEQAEQLGGGKLAIASTRQQMNPYLLLAAEQVAAVKALRAERIVLFYED